jgi:hypothetical protein
MRRLNLALGAAVIAAGAVLTVASPAMAEDVPVASPPDPAVDDSLGADTSSGLIAEDAKTAVPHSLPKDCIGPGQIPTVGDGCFHRYGDQIYVEDTANNGYTTYVYYQLYLYTSAKTWKLRRAGQCYAHGVDSWGECDYDFYEDSTVNAYGGKGSGVRIYLCETNSGCSQYYKWVRNNA